MKVYWFENTDSKPIEYSREAHSELVFKFLYWSEPESIMIVGSENMEFHGVLSEAAEKHNLCPKRKPDGAGTCIPFTKVIDSWFSVDFDVDTPEDLQPIIVEILFGEC